MLYIKLKNSFNNVQNTKNSMRMNYTTFNDTFTISML